MNFQVTKEFRRFEVYAGAENFLDYRQPDPIINSSDPFGDSDSYSSHGMLAKYSEQRGMGFSAASLTTQGTVTQGTVTRQYTYNYPMTANNTLTDAPTYTALTETWDGMDTNAAVTTYLLEKNATTRSTTIIYPIRQRASS